jgi:peptidoglycan/xylan/chitin deacetylase (PgdA/CDA1 family)
MLHRVGYQDENKLFANENMKVSPEFLDEFIRQQQKFYQFISMDELCLIKEGKLKLKKKFVVMTLDDGYLDNFELALPVFKKYNVPFIIFIASGLVDGNALLWWYNLEELILKK